MKIDNISIVTSPDPEKMTLEDLEGALRGARYALKPQNWPNHDNLELFAVEFAKHAVMHVDPMVVNLCESQKMCLSCMTLLVIKHFTALMVSVGCGGDHSKLHSMLNSHIDDMPELRRQALSFLNQHHASKEELVELIKERKAECGKE